MCGVARGKHDFIQMAIISLQSGFNLQIFISKWNPQQSSTNLGIYEDFKRLTMSSHSFAKFVKHAIIMQEKSGLWMPKKSTKGLLTNPGNLNYAICSHNAKMWLSTILGASTATCQWLITNLAVLISNVCHLAAIYFQFQKI